MGKLEAPKIEDTVARVKFALSDRGLTIDALHAWIDHAHNTSVVNDNEIGAKFAAQWSHAIHQASRHGGKGSMIGWFKHHLGHAIETLQVHQDGHVWAPAVRTVTEVRPTFVVIDGSRRTYRDGRVICTTADVLIIATTEAICAYRISGS